MSQCAYDINTGMVIYRSKFHASLKRNFQLLPAVKWLTLLLAHIPNKYESLVRYYGWYSNRAGGREMPKPVPSMPPPPCIWTRPQSIANPKLTGLGLFKRSMKSTRSNAPNATTPCASLPSSTTLLSSGIFSNTCTYGAPYRDNRTTPPATHRGRPIPPSHSPIILSRTSPERAGNNPARLKSCLFAPYTTDNDSSPVRAPVRPGVSFVCRGISRKCTNSRAAFPKFTTSPQLPQGLIFLSLLY